MTFVNFGMKIRLLAATAALALGGCATMPHREEPPPPPPVSLRIIAFNDFHGNLQPPSSAVTSGQGADAVRVPAGGAAYLASAIDSLREANPNHAVVSAGDMIGASPLVSALFLDEPTIHAMNLMRIDFNAAGNHEFDRGRAELLRMQNGGCEQHTARTPCAVDANFPGARFNFLAANTITETGDPLFPAYGFRTYGEGANQVKVAFIGLTLEETPTIVTPAGVAGLTFRDEADTVNALIPRLRAEGASVFVVLIHQGLSTTVGYNDQSCAGIDGDLLPILARLDPAVDLVVSGHTHNAYICDYARIDASRPFLVTSAGRYGTLVTAIDLHVDPQEGGVVHHMAENHIVQGEGYRSASGEVPVTDRHLVYPRNPEVAALVDRYAAASVTVASRVIGRFTGPAEREPAPSGEHVAGLLVADAQLTATRDPANGGAQIAFMNASGVRADIVPGPNGEVTYGHIFAAQPFGNSLVVKTFTGAQIRGLLEQQFGSGTNTPERPTMLMPSAGFTYAYDLARPAGQRILDMRLNGQPIVDTRTYRVTMNSFLATGGDNFTIFREGTDTMGGAQDLDALEAYIVRSSPLSPPAANRISRR